MRAQRVFRMMGSPLIHTLLLVMAIIQIYSFNNSFASASHKTLQRQRAGAALRWAPLVWHHIDEQIFPSSVPFFLRHVTLSSNSEQGQRVTMMTMMMATAPEVNLPFGTPSRSYHLLAPQTHACVHCTSTFPEFLYGQKPRRNFSPPVYATVHTCFPKPSRKDDKSSLNINDGDPVNDEINADDLEEDPSEYTHTATSTSSSSSSLLLTNITSALSDTQQQSDYDFISFNGDNSTLPTVTKHTENTTLTALTCNYTLCSENDTEEDNASTKNNNNNNTSYYYDDDVVNGVDLDNISMEEMNNSVLNKTDYLHSNESESVRNNSQVTVTDEEENNAMYYSTNDTETKHQNENETRETRHRIYGTNYVHEQQYSVTYWMFYPYNIGKYICTTNLGVFFGAIFKPRVNGVCHDEELLVGNHVGDWEHITINFIGDQPTRMYVSTHNFGAFYTYDPVNHVFVYSSQDTREGFPMSPTYPKTVHLKDSHPILYSARGSHGLWGAEGVHQYSILPLFQDVTGKGSSWKTWKNLTIIDSQDPSTLTPHRHWWNYEGKWGNPSSSCHVLLAGFCEDTGGVGGIPTKRINFPCQN